MVRTESLDGNSLQPQSFIDNGGLRWIFFPGAQNSTVNPACKSGFYIFLEYSTSVDGFTWTPPTNASLDTFTNLAVYSNGTDVFIVRDSPCAPSATFTDSSHFVIPLVFTHAKLTPTGGILPWSTDVVVANPLTGRYILFQASTLSLGGTFITSYSDNSNASLYASTSSTPFTSFATTNLYTNASGGITVSRLTSIGSSVYLTYSLTGANSPIYVRKWTGGSWGSQGTTYPTSARSNFPFTDGSYLYTLQKDKFTLAIMVERCSLDLSTCSTFNTGIIPDNSGGANYGLTYEPLQSLLHIWVYNANSGQVVEYSGNSTGPFAFIRILSQTSADIVNGGLGIEGTQYPYVSNGVSNYNIFWSPSPGAGGVPLRTIAFPAPLPPQPGGGGGGSGSIPPIVIPVVLAAAAQTFWDTFFSSLSGVIIFGWILLILGFTVYSGVQVRRKRRANRQRITLDHPVKARKQRIEV